LGLSLLKYPEYESLNKKDYFNILDGLGIKYEEKAYKTADVMEGYVVKLSKEPGEKINIETGEVLTVYVCCKGKKSTDNDTVRINAANRRNDLYGR
jgi:serine/threonine-protein kinase